MFEHPWGASNNIMKYIALVAILIPLIAAASGGRSSYQFLDITRSARMESIGGKQAATSTGDALAHLANPVFVDSLYNNQFGGTWGSIFVAQTEVGFGNAAFIRNIKDRPYAFSMRYINYGRFTSHDELGNQLPTAFASEYAAGVATSRQIWKGVSAGLQLKPIASYMAGYSSYAVLADLGAAYTDSTGSFTASLLFSNFGFRLKNYTAGNPQNLPFNVSIGVSKRLAHAPFRVSATYTSLNKWDISPPKKEKKSALAADNDDKEDLWDKFGENALRHFVVGIELFLGKKLYVASGMDFHKYFDMSMQERSGAPGLSMGLGLELASFRLSYGRSSYHLAGATNFFSICTGIDRFFVRKTKINAAKEE
jgi:hypothetical protein